MRSSLRLCAFALILFLPPTALAARVERLIDTWRPTHYFVNITLNDQLSEITSASARIDVSIVKPTRTIDLDFGDLTVDSATLNSNPVTVTHNNGKLLFALPQTANPGDSFVLTINYHGKPKDGLILTNDKDGKPSAMGDNWPDRVHHWIPVLDHPSAKATITFNITAPAGQEVVANGRLDHVETSASGQRTWTYSEGVPIPPYCMIIGVGQFARVEPAQRALTPLSYYVPLSERELAQKGFSPAIPTLEFFTEKVAPYPYEKLGLIVGATRFGGMENSGAIVFTSALFNRNSSAGMSKTFGVPFNNVTLIAHEIAHQWFGDSVTESTWSDLWLSEGFATYFAGLFVQRYESEEAFQRYLHNAAASVFEYEKKKRVPIFDRDTESLMELLNPNNYQKGAWVLHMLRSNLGDDVFFRGIRAYYESHKNSVASTEDLRAALEKASGKDLRAFFTRWVYDSGHPQYELKWYWLGKKELRVVLTQTQPGNAFVDPVPVTISTATGKKDLVLKPTGKLLIERIPLRDKPVRIDLDPDNRLLDESTVKGS
ncbi:MAG TPA: M1 family metallopeptidase [Pyrinomonadaceae bacterium]|nr:M1 family metallopeptidase [Pyrinomonadaceae bacterium]